MPKQQLRERLKQALQRAGMKQSQLASTVGISRASVSDWLTGATKTLEGKNLTKAADALGVDPHWLATGEGAPHVAEPAATYGLATIRSWEHEDDLPPGEYAFIPRLDVHVSMGHGRDSGKHQIEIELIQQQPQAFRAEWIRKMRLKPAKLAVATAHGDSGEPRIFDGDALVVNTADINIVDGKLYWIWYDGGERVKRLYRLPGGGLLLRSDNEAKYPPITLTPEQAEAVRVVGRIVHVAGEGGL